MNSPEVERYAAVIRSMVDRPPAFAPTAEPPGVVQVERGTDDRVPPVAAVVIDAAGHRRPAYRGLLVCCWLTTAAAGPVRDWCESLAGVAEAGPTTAARGADVAAAAWAAVALHRCAGRFDRPEWVGRAATFFDHLAASATAAGPMLTATSSDNPETHWYHELVLLHAAADYAYATGHDRLTAAVARAAEYHTYETQPDHATSQPWGLPAFVRVPAARPLADQVLHAVQTQHPGGAVGVPLLLLADTLYGLSQTP